MFEEIIAKNFSELVKKTNLQVQETQWSPSRIYKKIMIRHILNKAARENWYIIYKGTLI